MAGWRSGTGDPRRTMAGPVPRVRRWTPFCFTLGGLTPAHPSRPGEGGAHDERPPWRPGAMGKRNDRAASRRVTKGVPACWVEGLERSERGQRHGRHRQHPGWAVLSTTARPAAKGTGCSDISRPGLPSGGRRMIDGAPPRWEDQPAAGHCGAKALWALNAGSATKSENLPVSGDRRAVPLDRRRWPGPPRSDPFSGEAPYWAHRSRMVVFFFFCMGPADRLPMTTHR